MSEWAMYGITGKVVIGQPARAMPYRKALDQRIARAMDVLRVFLSKHRAYSSLSFGADSLVSDHLARQINPAIPAVWVDQGPFAEWPDCLALKDQMVADGLPLVELHPDITLYDWYREYGIPIGSSMSNTEDERLNEALMYAPIRRYQTESGRKAFIWGLRHDGEGGHRAFVIKGKGPIYTRKADGVTVCSPVGNWTKAEIFAYIDHYQLAYPAMYDRDRAEIRNGPPIGTSALNMGRIAKLRLYFPEIWRVVVMEFPELQRYT